MKERAAIVTGAGKRVGAQIARALVADGWEVFAHVRSEQDHVPDGAIKIVADLTDPDCGRKIFSAAQSESPVRLLVNNAARFSWDAFGEFDVGEFDRHMAVNLRAPILLIEEFAKVHEKGDALVVNILDSKLSGSNPDFLSYTLSKHALGTLSELAARALAPRKIRVNGIAPALMLRSNGQSEENFKAMHANNPLQRPVAPDDVIDAIRFLIEARGVTGQVITIDSGQRFMALPRDVQFLDFK